MKDLIDKFCPINRMMCHEKCAWMIQWSNGQECAIHAIAVELNDEDDSEEGEEEFEEQSTLSDEQSNSSDPQ